LLSVYHKNSRSASPDFPSTESLMLKLFLSLVLCYNKRNAARRRVAVGGCQYVSSLRKSTDCIRLYLPIPGGTQPRQPLGPACFPVGLGRAGTGLRRPFFTRRQTGD